MYAVIGVTGQVGSVVANQLKKRGLGFKAVVRSADKGELLREQGIDSVIADLQDGDALTIAFKDMEGVFIVTPPLLDSNNPLGDQLKILEALSTAIKNVKPLKVVYLSSVGAQHENGLGAIRKLHDSEVYFQKLNVPTVSIRAAWFMENFTRNVKAIKETEKMYGFISPSDLAIPMVAVEDIGILGADLLEEKWEGHRVIELTGPDTYSCKDVADTFSKLLGKSISLQTLTQDEYKDAYLSIGFTEAASELMSEMNEGFNKGYIVFENSKGILKGDSTLEDVLKVAIENSK